jgi:hypothetical protein
MKLLVLISCLALGVNAAFGAILRIGIIGCDTSHVTAFTETLNNPDSKGHVPGGKVVAAFKGGSADIPESASRVDGYAKTLREKYDVKFYDTIEELCRNVDAVLLESVDGRPHLEQAKQVFRFNSGLAGKTRLLLFIDKPVAGSLQDAIQIFSLAKASGTPVFSSSGLRFAKDSQAVRQGSLGKVTYAETYGPCTVEPHHPDLFWYGVHAVESLYTVMGTGCESVQRGTNAGGKVEVIGFWRDGKKGVVREDQGFHGVAKGEKGEAPVGSFDGYVPLVAEIMKFFQSGVAPVQPEETIEIFTFMEAADVSKRDGGKPVKIADVLKANQR